MKKTTLFILLLLVSIAGNAQNNASQGTISTSIPLSPLGAQEVFRFKPGIVTHLQAGTFGFTDTDRWSSFGEITTPPSGQRLHGLRIQDEGKALVMGYSSAEQTGFIQYIADGLDIRFSDSFTSTVSQRAAYFGPLGNSFFGFADPILSPISTRPPRAQVDIQSRFGLGLRVAKGNNDILPANFTAAEFQGPITATSATFTSDSQFKKDVRAEQSALEVISQLNPVTYMFKEENKFNIAFPAGLQHGFIAQELERVLPELVVNHKEEGVGSYKSVNYVALIPLLTKSIQELSLEVEELKKQLAEAKTYVVSKESFTKSEIEKISENGFYLAQNTPNPFSNITEIAYSYPKGQQNVVLMVFNLNGEKLKEFALKEEKGVVALEAAGFKPGLYLYSLISDNSEIITKKMLVK